MGRYLDRTSKLHQAGTEFSTPEQDENPVTDRARTAMRYMTKDMSNSNRKFAYITRKIVDEALSDAAEVPSEILGFYMKQASAILYWVASGENVLDMPLPADFPVEQPAIQAEPEPAPALEAGSGDS